MLSRWFQYCRDGFNTVPTVSILSGRFQYCLDGFNTVWTVSILSGRFQYCPDGFNTVRTVSILSGRFQYCPEGFNTVRNGFNSVRTVSILSRRFQYCSDSNITDLHYILHFKCSIHFKVNDEHCICLFVSHCPNHHKREENALFICRDRGLRAFLTCREK